MPKDHSEWSSQYRLRESATYRKAACTDADKTSSCLSICLRSRRPWNRRFGPRAGTPSDMVPTSSPAPASIRSLPGSTSNSHVDSVGTKWAYELLHASIDHLETDLASIASSVEWLSYNTSNTLVPGFGLDNVDGVALCRIPATAVHKHFQNFKRILRYTLAIHRDDGTKTYRYVIERTPLVAVFTSYLLDPIRRVG